MGKAVDYEHVIEVTLHQNDPINHEIFYLNSIYEESSSRIKPICPHGGLHPGSTKWYLNKSPFNLAWTQAYMQKSWQWQSSQRKNMQHLPWNDFKKQNEGVVCVIWFFCLNPNPFTWEIYTLLKISATFFSNFFLWVSTPKRTPVYNTLLQSIWRNRFSPKIWPRSY